MYGLIAGSPKDVGTALGPVPVFFVSPVRNSPMTLRFGSVGSAMIDYLVLISLSVTVLRVRIALE